MASTPAEMIEAVLRNLPKNTGKTHAQWKKVAAKGPADAKARYGWLRQKHGLGHLAAMILAGLLKPYDAPDKLVAAQYKTRPTLRPIYDQVVASAQKLGRDVSAKPCKTYVPLHRTKTFAVVKPGSNRVDVGLTLGTLAFTTRLRKAKGLGSDRITHMVSLVAPAQVDAEFKRWLKLAYEQA